MESAREAMKVLNAKGKPIRIDFRRSVFHREIRLSSNNKGMSIVKA